MYNMLMGYPLFSRKCLYAKTQFASGGDTVRSDYSYRNLERGVTDALGLTYELADGHEISLYGSFNYSRFQVTNHYSTFGELPRHKIMRSPSLSWGVAAEYKGDLGIGEQSTARLWASFSQRRVRDYDAYYDQLEVDSAERKSFDYYLEPAPTLSFTFGGGHTLKGGLYFDYGFDQLNVGGLSLPDLG